VAIPRFRPNTIGCPDPRALTVRWSAPRNLNIMLMGPAIESRALAFLTFLPLATRRTVGFKSKRQMTLPGVAQPAIQEGRGWFGAG
jgi:hypothetical protein